MVILNFLKKSKILFTCSLVGLLMSLLSVSQPLLMTSYMILLGLFISGVFIFSGSSWLGLVFFMVYVGGVFVLYMYSASSSPNMSASSSQKTKGILFLLMFSVITSMAYSSSLATSNELNSNMIMLFSPSTSGAYSFLVAILGVILFYLWSLLKTPKASMFRGLS